MSKYLVETFYTCSFKIVHKLDEINEKNLAEIENRNDGKFEIIDVKLNNRKTKTINDKKMDISLPKETTKNIPDVSSIVNETIVNSEKLKNTNEFERGNSEIGENEQDFTGKIKSSDPKELSLSMEQDGRRGET